MTGGIQRPLKGSRISTFYPVKNLPSLASLDSAFQLQEYISLLIRLDVHDVEAITSLPGSKEGESEPGNSKEEKDKEAEKGKGEVSVDRWCWVYEQLRRLAQDLTHPLITTLQQECTRASCPEMKAGEWLYLCVAHGNEGSMEQCCAIDYILHTLDSATALLNSPRAFPSRLSIPESSQRHFSSLARRLGRIFAHAYFHHREAFEQAEAESSLYARFLALTSKFDLVPPEFLPIPREAFYANADDQVEGYSRDAAPPRLLAAGLEPQSSEKDLDHQQRQQQQQQQLQSILQHPSSSSQHLEPPRDASSSSPSPPGLASEGSPRRSGRHRTDTMVFSEVEASSFAEQYAARSAGSSSEEQGGGEEENGQVEDVAATAEEQAPEKEKTYAEAVVEKVEELEPVEEDIALVDLTDKSSTSAETAVETQSSEEEGNSVPEASDSTKEEPAPAPPTEEETPAASVEEEPPKQSVEEAVAVEAESQKDEPVEATKSEPEPEPEPESELEPEPVKADATTAEDSTAEKSAEPSSGVVADPTPPVPASEESTAEDAPFKGESGVVATSDVSSTEPATATEKAAPEVEASNLKDAKDDAKDVSS